ncbi:MAG: Lrp/AsnC family transcriptional regulator [Candidatus Woesearchaeota archaeon]
MLLNLDKIDQRILYELDKNARIPETGLAKLVHRSKESIRYRIKKLEQEKIIQGFTIWIDPTKIGYSSAKIYLNIANKPEQKKELIEFVTKDKRLFWLGVAEGSWNLGMTFFVQSNQEFFELKNQLISRFKDLIIDSHTAILIGVNYCNKNFFFPGQNQWKQMFSSREDYNLDQTEKAILKELFQNSRVSVVEIARKNETTVDIVRNRIRKMEERRIISRYLTKINYNKLGYEFYKTFLYFKNLNTNDERKLMQYALEIPQIVHLVKQISPWDIELEIMCESYHQYNEIISKITREFSSIINRVETAIMGEDYVWPAEKMIFE